MTESSKRHAKALAGMLKGGTLVLPFEAAEVGAEQSVPGFQPGTVDLPGRLVMAQLLAQRLAASGDLVADPTIVGLALGEQRTYKAHELLELVQASGAARVITGTVAWLPRLEGAELRRTLTVTVEVKRVDRPASGQVSLTPVSGPFRREGVSISDTALPERAFAAMLDEIAGHFGLPGTPPPSISGEAAGRFPSSPKAAITGEGAVGPDDLWATLLLAKLRHGGGDGESGFVAVNARLLATLELVPADARDRRLLAGHALYALERRPAALAALSPPTEDPEEHALRAALNGDLPALTAATKAIVRPVPRLLAEVDLLQMRWSYGLGDRDELKAEFERLAALAPDGWHPLIGWRLIALDAWALGEPLELKAWLDRDFPVAGQDLEALLRGKLALGGASESAGQLAALPTLHLGAVLAGDPARFCCARRPGAPVPYDYLGLLHDEAVERVAKQVRFLDAVQGRPEDAVRLAEELGRADLRGLPSLALAHAQALGDGRQGYGQTPLAKQMVELATFASVATPWQSDLGADAHELLINLPGHPLTRSPPWAHDFPPRWRWSLRLGVVAIGPMMHLPAPDGDGQAHRWRTRLMREEACRYTTLSPSACLQALEVHRSGPGYVFGRADAPTRLAELVKSRFHGSDEYSALVAAIATERGDTRAGIDAYRDDVARYPQRWSGYGGLVVMHLARGAYRDAAEAALAYPPFGARQRGFTVALSNQAEIVGHELARRGAIDEARPLLRIAADNADGSGSSMHARYLLAAADGRFGDALDAAGDEARRYGNGGALHRYVAMLFLAASGKDGWAVFQEGRKRSSDFRLWRAASVGLRADGADAATVTKWAADQDAAQNPGRRANPHAAQPYFDAAFAVLAIDRPAGETAVLLASERELRYAPTGDPERDKRIAAERAQATPNAREAVGNGYEAVKGGDYAAAIRAFEAYPAVGSDANRVWLFRDEAGRSAMPYWMFAAAKTGGAGRIAAQLDHFPVGDASRPPHSFERSLGDAITAALAGDHARAEQALRLARANMPAAGLRLLPPEYVLAEICELLARETKRPAYLAIGVEWARQFQRYEPYAAWAYAFEARHARPGSERTRAIAMALHLDPRSARLAQLDPRTKDEARAWFKARDPLGLKQRDRPRKPEQTT